VKFYVTFGKISPKAMSRIGRSQILIPSTVKVTESEGRKLLVDGPNGKLSIVLPSRLQASFESNNGACNSVTLFLSPNADEDKLSHSLRGLFRTLLANMITGVSEGFTRKLQLSGVGYRAELSGKNLILHLGFSHPVQLTPPPNTTVTLDSQTRIIVSGIDKRSVGEFAAKIRSIRPPEPYKGKGVTYEGEIVLRKAGKTGKK
jgi:large subunit ribosomal protein L6